MKNDTLRMPLASSCLIHLLILVIASLLVHQQRLRRPDLLPIELLDVPRPAPVAIEKPVPAVKPVPPPPVKIEKPKEPKPAVKTEMTKIEKPAPPPAPTAKDEPPAGENKAPTPAKTESPPIPSSRSNVEGGGSAAGAGDLFGKGDVAVLPGSGTSGGGGGTAASGLGRGSEAPGLPAQTAPLRTNREAKPIQMARATYPPTALRIGMEGDVTLKIIVDPDGSVSKAEIIKRGGNGFDEEALRAVKQSRFEPAHKDGQNVTAEFTFIFHFRLRR